MKCRGCSALLRSGQEQGKALEEAVDAHRNLPELQRAVARVAVELGGWCTVCQEGLQRFERLLGHSHSPSEYEAAALRGPNVQAQRAKGAEQTSLEAFAASALVAAKMGPTRDGDKTFIVTAYERFCELGGVGTLPAFKASLIAANKKGLLYLSRADQVEHMDARLVRQSEAQHLIALFHFIRIDQPQVEGVPLKLWAKMVNRAASLAHERECANGDRSKVWISELYKGRRDLAPSLDKFKDQLLQARKQRLLTLTRCDLPAAAPQGIVRESLTESAGQQFHFIRISDAATESPNDSGTTGEDPQADARWEDFKRIAEQELQRLAAKAAPIPLVWVPDLVRAIAAATTRRADVLKPIVHSWLWTQHNNRTLALRAEGGMGRLSAEDAALCPTNADRVPLSQVLVTPSKQGAR